VLVVDDSSMIRDMVTDMIERLRHEALCAPNGRLALEAPRCDVVLLDMEVGDMTGIEIARSLRERGYGGPIFGLSGHRRMPGLDGHLRKPFGLRDVATLLGVARARVTLGDADIVAGMLRDLTEELPRLVEQAKQTTDLSEIRRLAHTIRGSLRFLEEPPALAAAARLEEAAKEGRIDGEALTELEAAVKDLVPRLARLSG